jgi:hypothetical protein
MKTPRRKKGSSMKNTRKVAVALGAFALMALAASCTNKASNSSGNSAASVQAYNSPTASCAIMNGSTTLLTVTNLTSSSPVLFTPPEAPVSISIDCSKSIPHSPGSSLSGTYSVNGSSTSTSLLNLKSGSPIVFGAPGKNSITINLVDSAGLITTVTFSMPVSCNAANYPALKGPTGVSVSQGSSGPGFFNVALNGAGAGGGGGPYQYAIDLNGDGRFDYYTAQNATPAYWNTGTSWLNMYNFYGGNRPISIQTYDTACQFLRTDNFAENWSASLLPVQSGAMNAIPPVEPYSYLQANVSSGSGSTDPAEAVSPFNAQDTTGSRVTCNFSEQGSNGVASTWSYTIQATNYYNDGVSTDQGALTESMTLAMQGNVSNLGPVSVPMQSVSYQTQASMNGVYQQYSYNMPSAGCTAFVQVIPGAVPGPCPSGETGVAWGGGTVMGTFSCDGMASTPSGRSLNLDKGYFYCPFIQGSSCVGGGQEGGGPPPSF